jgi:hypothetical protein
MNHFVRGEGLCESQTSSVAQDLLRILQGAGGSHQPSFRHRESYLEVPVFEVKLSRPEVGEGIPPVDVIEDCDLRIPLGDIEETMVDVPLPRSSCGWDDEVPGKPQFN